MQRKALKYLTWNDCFLWLAVMSWCSTTFFFPNKSPKYPGSSFRSSEQSLRALWGAAIPGYSWKLSVNCILNFLQMSKEVRPDSDVTPTALYFPPRRPILEASNLRTNKHYFFGTMTYSSYSLYNYSFQVKLCSLSGCPVAAVYLWLCTGSSSPCPGDAY